MKNIILPFLVIFILTLSLVACLSSDADSVNVENDFGDSEPIVEISFTETPTVLPMPLPTSTTIPTSVPKPTEDPEIISFEFLQIANYIYENTLNFVGLVEYTGNVPILLFPGLEFVLKNEDGAIVEIGTLVPVIRILQPGDTSPFQVSFFGNPQNWNTFEILELEHPEWMKIPESDFTRFYYDLEISEYSVKPNVYPYGPWLIEGEIENIGKSAATNIQIIAVLFDPNGNTLAVGGGTTDIFQLLSNTSSTFRCEFGSAAPGEIGSVKFWITGQKE